MYDPNDRGVHDTRSPAQQPRPIRCPGSSQEIYQPPPIILETGSTQPVVFRPSTGQFIGAGGAIIATFGQSGDIPLAAPLSYRMPSSDPPAPAPAPAQGLVRQGPAQLGHRYRHRDWHDRDRHNRDRHDRDRYNREPAQQELVQATSGSSSARQHPHRHLPRALDLVSRTLAPVLTRKKW